MVRTSLVLAAAVVALTSACSTDDPRRSTSTSIPTSTPSPAQAAAGSGTPTPSPSPTPTSPPTPTPSKSAAASPEPAPEPRRSFVTIPAIGLKAFPVVRYRGSPDDGPGTELQNAGEMASPRGARGGVRPGAVGNFIVTGHRLTGTAPLRYAPSLRRGDRIRVRTGDTVYVYEVRRTRRTSFREPRSLRAQRSPVPGRIGEEATEPMITLSTCATLEDHADGNYWSDEFDNPEHRIDKIGVLVDTRPA